MKALHLPLVCLLLLGPASRAQELLAFSCKGRGFGPSCGVRRMSAQAAHLVDHVLPAQPIRQWVLALPLELRYAAVNIVQRFDSALRLNVHFRDVILDGVYGDGLSALSADATRGQSALGGRAGQWATRAGAIPSFTSK